MCIQPKISNADNEQLRQLINDNGADKPGFWFGSLGKYSYANDIRFYVNFAEFGLVSCLHIGKHCSIALNVKLLFNRNHDYKSLTTSASRLFYGRPWVIQQKGQIIIGNDVWIGNDVNILSGVRIGDGAIIGAGAVVSKDIPPYAIAVGNPIRVMKYRYSEEEIRKLLKIRWWDWEDEKIAANKNLFSAPVNEFLEKFYDSEDSEKPDKESLKISMGLKKTVFLTFADTEDPYPIWEKNLTEYIDHFSINDPVSLVLVVKESSGMRKAAEKLLQDLKDVKKAEDRIDAAPQVKIISVSDKVSENGLFTAADYYLVNRCEYAMEHIQQCDDFGVKLLSGVDVPVFRDLKI